MKRLVRHIIFGILLVSGALPLYAQMTIKTPKQDVAIEMGRIAITVVGKPGAKAWLYVNDALADSGEIRIDGKYDFLNIEVPEGPVELRTEAVGAGNRIFKATRQVHVIGSPAKIIADKNAIEMPADSQSVQSVKIEIQDAWGYRINRLKTINVSISKGRINAADVDSISAGWQLPVHEGQAEIPIRAASAVGQETVSVRIGDAVLDIPVRYTTPLMEFMMVGSLDAAASLAQSGDKDYGEPKFTLADWTYQEGDYKGLPVSGRMAFYAKGSLLRKYQVTASFDSRRTQDNQVFRDLDPDKQYALYGDASTLTYDAQTQSKFYGKIERNESFLVLGDFNTNIRSTEFAKYDRSFTGVYSKLQTGNQSLTGFATLNDRTMELDEIRGEGVSGYYYLSASQITVNSDKIRIETRDRYHPEKVLRSDEQVRYQDYDINYVDGTLMFKQPVSSVDDSGNPMYIVAAYEYQSRSAKSLIGGLRYDGAVMKKIQLGSTFIVEEKNPSNYYLYGADVRIPISKRLKIKGEVAQSRSADFSEEEQAANAYSIEADIKPHKALELNGYYRNVDEDFSNASQTGSQFEVGAEKYGASGALDLGKIGKIRSEFYRQLSDVGTVNEQHVQLGNAAYEYAFNNKTTAKVGYEDAERKKMGQDSVSTRAYRSNMIKGQVAHRWNERLSTTLDHDQNIGDGTTSLPTSTSIGVSYRLTRRVDLFLKERVIAATGRTQTIFGIDSKVSKNSQVSGKYEIGGVSGEQLSRATIGLKNKWDVRKDLTLNTAFESTATLDSLEVPTPDHSAISFGLEYLPDKPWKSSCKYELRQDQVVRKQVVALASEFKILDGLSAITRIEDSRAKYLKTKDDVWNRGNYQAGVAYRPELSDVFNALAKMQLITDKNTHVAPKTRLDRLIVSMHGYWQATRRLEFGLRFALRQLIDEETGLLSSKTTTSLYALHGNFDYRRWIIGMDLRLVTLSPLGQNKTGLAGEVGYLFKKNMTVGIGYIFKQLDDADFSYSDYTYQNFYLLFRMKFSEDIFDWR